MICHTDFRAGLSWITSSNPLTCDTITFRFTGAKSYQLSNLENSSRLSIIKTSALQTFIFDTISFDREKILFFAKHVGEHPIFSEVVPEIMTCNISILSSSSWNDQVPVTLKQFLIVAVSFSFTAGVLLFSPAPAAPMPYEFSLRGYVL